MNKLQKNIFKNKQKPTVIGMVHCAPLFGYTDSPGEKEVNKKFMSDLKVLVNGGVDAVMIENNYDIPHYEKAKRSTITQLTKLCLQAREFTNKPLGLCILWNDYETALSIAKVAKFNFIRVPVFVDKVETAHGVFDKKAKECLQFRKQIDAEDILIFADIQVKHAKHLIKRSLKAAAKDAIKNNADGIIITGKWTGDPPTLEDVSGVKEVAKNIPVILGSGITPDNISNYDVDGMIVGSYFKEKFDPKEKDFHNIFPWKSKVKLTKVKKFMKSI